MAMRDFFFGTPFAAVGDKTEIPRATVPDGSVSVAQGYGPDYQRDMLTDPLAKPIERGGMNWLFNQITQLLGRWQTETVPEWVSAADNNGVAIQYQVGSQVRYRVSDVAPFLSYVSVVENNDSVPTNPANWVQTSLGATANKIDSSKKAATTEFVNSVVGNIGDLIAITASRNVTLNDIGSTLYFSNMGSVLTLPRPSSVGIPFGTGRCVRVICVGDVTGSITVPGDTVLTYGATVVPNVTVKPGQYVLLTAASGANWQVVESTADMSHNADFAVQLTGSGFQRLPGGLIMQWITNGEAGTVGEYVDNYFEIPFPNVCLAATATHVGTDPEVTIVVDGLNPDKLSYVRIRSNYAGDLPVLANVIAFGY